MFRAEPLLRDQYIPDTTSTWIRPAGITTAFNESVGDAMNWEQKPPTPQKQRKYRQSTLHEPGRIVKHPGAADDSAPQGPFGHKTVSRPGDDVASVIKSHPCTQHGQWTLERAENVYDSSRREPLGKGYVRGFRIPEGLGTERPFGRPLGAQEKAKAGQLGNVIFPADCAPTTSEDERRAHELYRRTHAAYDPGEQRHRNYDWAGAGLDPSAHRFGAVDKDDYQQGVHKALQPGLDQTREHPSKIAVKIHEDYKLSANDYLGKPKKLGAGDRHHLPPDHAYGLHSMRHGAEAGVDRLIQGMYSDVEQQPDADLGKSLREGWRNVPAPGRTFGVPSIRTDVPLPKARSLANTMNYGNEPDAFQLLRPPRSVERGVYEEHYMALRPRDEVRSLMEEAGVKLDTQEFDQVFDMAVNADGEQQCCCLDTFFRARHHLLAQTITVSVPF